MKEKFIKADANFRELKNEGMAKIMPDEIYT